MLYQEPYKKVKTVFWKITHFRENAYFSGNFRPFLAKKCCNQVPTWPKLPLPLNVKQHSKELRCLMRAGTFSQNECLLKNINGIMYENPREHSPLFPHCRRPCPPSLWLCPWASAAGSRGAGQRELCPPWIFIHDTDKVEEDLMILFFGLVFSVGLPHPAGIFSADPLHCAHPLPGLVKALVTKKSLISVTCNCNRTYVVGFVFAKCSSVICWHFKLSTTNRRLMQWLPHYTFNDIYSQLVSSNQVTKGRSELIVIEWYVSRQL